MNNQGIYNKENVAKGVYIYTENSNFIQPKFWGLYEENEKPAGSVIFADRNLLVALNGSESDIRLLDWGIDLKSTEYENIDSALTDQNGEETTAQLAETGSPAALFCMDYKCGHVDKWYLPTLSDMQLMYDHQKELDIALAIAGGNAIETDDWHWTSTRRYDKSHWLFNWLNGIEDIFNQNGSCRVRPVSASFLLSL